MTDKAGLTEGQTEGQAGNQTDDLWHARDGGAVCAAFNTSPEGLSAAEARVRLEACGPNRLPASRKRTAYERLWAHINSPLIWIMLVAAVVAGFLGHTVDAVVICLVIVVNTIIGYVQEGKAEKALDAIADMMAPHAQVWRDGQRLSVSAEDIVPGDVVWLEAGDRVPADLRLIQAKSLKVEEAALTGESVPVEKHPDVMAEDTPLAERAGMAFSGTFVTTGQGAGVVVGTGAQTELGRINAMLSRVEQLKTPLLQQMDWLAGRLTLIILAVAVALFVFAAYVRGYAFDEALMIVIGFAVAVVPEGLPAVMTITLAIGVHRMARRHAIIRRLPAVETLGAVSVICSDKTGTLTRNEMMVGQVVTAEGIYEINGQGYAPEGEIGLRGQAVNLGGHAAAQTLARAAVLCNDAALRQTEDSWGVVGDPMEGALVALGGKAGFAQDVTRTDWPRLDAIPFDAVHRFMATLHRDPETGQMLIYLKGAPEQVIAMCGHEMTSEGSQALDPAVWQAHIEQLALKGQRVLALAAKKLPEAQGHIGFDDTRDGLTLLGLVGLIDPPREEAIASVADCRRAGIRVVMITGDHAATALAIARQLKLADDPKVMTGQALEDLSDEDLKTTVRQVSVFARANPEHKLRLVQAFQANDMIIAMTGDGVNDAPALKQANVGVAMGNNGTEVAKEAAEVVLADDNFASIAAAVREGRTVYDNLRKVIGWTLPTNVGEVGAILIAVFLGLTLPMTPVQILWINMVTSVGLGLVLAFEPTEPGTMRKAPRPANEPIISGFMLWRILFVASLFVAGVFAMFNYGQWRGLPLEASHTLVVNTIVVLEIAYLFSVRYVHGTSLTLKGVVGTPAVLLGVSTITAAQFAVTYVPFLNRAFGTHPLGFVDGLMVVGVGVLFLMVLEVEKRVTAE